MPQFTFRERNAAMDVSCGTGSLVVNAGPSTVYFRDEQPVSTTVNDGVLAAGQSTTLAGIQYFYVASGVATVTVSSPVVASATAVLDEARSMVPYTVPTTATTAATAVGVPGLVISPTCLPGTIRLSAFTTINHGATGWSAGRNMTVFIGDDTSLSPVPIVTGVIASTHGQVTGGTGAYVPAAISGDFPIAPAEAGTRIFKVYAFVSNAALTGATVYSDPSFLSWIRCEQVAA